MFILIFRLDGSVYEIKETEAITVSLRSSTQVAPALSYLDPRALLNYTSKSNQIFQSRYFIAKYFDTEPVY